MPSLSKENRVLQLILENSPMREWHFDEIVREAKVSKVVANKWLRKFSSEGLIARVKQIGKFPFYSVGIGNPVYLSLKRVYALDLLHQCGLIPKLMSMDCANTVILFGSIAKGDWYKDSDIDVFIFGEPGVFEKSFFESRLKRKIELHIFHDANELRAVETGLLQKVINGYVIKGQIQDIVGPALIGEALRSIRSSQDIAKLAGSWDMSESESKKINKDLEGT